MPGKNRRKCRSCLKFFTPDPRNQHRQHYCSSPACRAASKANSQARWRQKPENQAYFRGPVHVARVQAWRRAHPGYGKRPARCRAPLQDPSMPQAIESKEESAEFALTPLQEIISAQPAVLIGLIAHIVASPLQEDIAATSRHLLQLGQDILAGNGFHTRAAHRPDP